MIKHREAKMKTTQKTLEILSIKLNNLKGTGMEELVRDLIFKNIYKESERFT